MHPGVNGYVHKFLSVAQEHFEERRPIQIVFKLKKYPDIVIDEYVFHVHPKEFELSRAELDRHIVDIVQSLKVVALDSENSISKDGEFTFALSVREEEIDVQFPVVDENSTVVFVKTEEEECPRMIPMKRFKKALSSVETDMQME